MGTLTKRLDDNTVHLCIDMQRLFGTEGPWPTPWLEKILPAVAALVEHSPSHTIFTRFVPAQRIDQCHGTWRAFYEKWPETTLDRIDVTLVDLLPALDRHVPPARTFDRHVYSAFVDGRLNGELRRLNVSTLIVSGAETDICVLATVLGALDYGYRTIIARDAIASSSDETHDALLKLYSTRFNVQIELVDVQEICGAWKVD